MKSRNSRRDNAKYIVDTRPCSLFIKDVNSPILWADLTWYHKKKFINDYLESVNKEQINDLRDYVFKDIAYDPFKRKILNVEIIKN